MINVVLQVVGTALAVAGVLAVRMPQETKRVVSWLESGRGLRVAAIGVAVLGAFLAVGAGLTRWPMAMHVLGLALLSVGIVSAAMGRRTLRALTTWWLEQGAFVYRASAWTLAIFGVVIVVAAR